MTSLEEVFLNIAKQAEVDAGNGEMEEVVLEDGSTLEVALGHDRAVHKDTDKMYSVKWTQGEDGALHVASWTELSDDEHEDKVVGRHAVESG
jgi:ferric-dicitrate binding protein FerR (iron transport regulator)